MINDALLKRMETDDNIESVLDEIYNIIDDALWAGQFYQISLTFKEMNISKIRTVFLIGLLTASLFGHDKIESRANFFDRVKQELISRGSSETELHQLLDGLQYPNWYNQQKERPMTK